jgi:predicted transcriptional regulator
MRLKQLLKRKNVKPFHLSKTLKIPISSLHYHLEHGKGLQAKYAEKIILLYPDEISLAELVIDKPKKSL